VAVVETLFFVAILIINYRIFKTFKTRFAENDKKEKDDKNLILSNSIRPKKMFYNEKETGEIQKLVSLLSNENYCKIQERLGKKGLRNGLTCLFTGGPGTGKTETAYQIARQTGRNIMAVNIAETKSMFFGVSDWILCCSTAKTKLIAALTLLK
jgi:ATP-dependent Zn protease